MVTPHSPNLQPRHSGNGVAQWRVEAGASEFQHAWHGMRIVRKLRLGWFESFVAEQLGQTGDSRGH